MIKTREDLRYYLGEDAKRNRVTTNFFKYLIQLLLKSENAYAYRYLRALRHCEYHSNNSSLYHKLAYYYYRIKKSRLGGKYHIQIPLNKTGYGLRIMHLSGGGGILLNVHSIGNYCGFNSGVLLGDNGENALPTLGDYVAFGPGAKAFGRITIGNNVFVAPNSVVTKDVPDNAIVGGVPANIIKYKDIKK